jgi:hypothetical protein
VPCTIIYTLRSTYARGIDAQVLHLPSDKFELSESFLRNDHLLCDNLVALGLFVKDYSGYPTHSIDIKDRFDLQVGKDYGAHCEPGRTIKAQHGVLKLTFVGAAFLRACNDEQLSD